MMNIDLAAPCGLYCGICRQYLARKKDMLEQKGLKIGCQGCRIRNKKCAFIKRDCKRIWKHEIDFCGECEEFPCENLERLDSIYQDRYNVSLIDNLRRINEIGAEDWLKEQIELYTCPKCEGEICLHDGECYDCGLVINPNKA